MYNPKTDNLANNYVSKIRHYYESHFPYKMDYDARISLHESLMMILDNNLEYLLTDSLLDFVSHYDDKETVAFIKKLNGSIYDIIDLLKYYFGKLFDELLYRDPDLYCSYIYELDDDLKRSTNIIAKELKSLRELATKENYNYNDIQEIIYIIFAYYVFYDREEDIFELCNTFLDDPGRVLDGINFNNIHDDNITNAEEDKRLIDFVLRTLNNRNQKEIR